MARSKRQEKIKRPIAPLRVSVKFLEDSDPGRGKSIFKKGSVKELVISSANHWIRRGKAERYVEKPMRAKSVRPKPAKSVRSWKKVAVKAKSVVEETVGEETTDYETAKAEPLVEETVSEERTDEDSVIEEKKTEDGESLGEIPDLMA